MRSLSDDVDSLCLEREYCELETYYGTNFTDTVLIDANSISHHAIKKTLKVIDRDKLVEKCVMRSPSIADIYILLLLLHTPQEVQILREKERRMRGRSIYIRNDVSAAVAFWTLSRRHPRA